MLGLSQETHQGMGLPTFSIGTLPTTNPTAGKRSVAHGKVGDRPRVMVEVSGACVLTLYIWSPASSSWIYPSATTAGYQVTFAAAGMEYFDLPPGAYFYIKSDTGSITCYADCDDPIQRQL